MQINGVSYSVIDSIEKITIADSIVANSNKLGSGNGEAKLYVGNDSTSLRNFFGNRGFVVNCFFVKSELQSFLRGLEPEYRYPKLNYRKKDDLPRLFDKRMHELEALPEIINFQISDQNQLAGPRVYVNSNSTAYSLLRNLSLPNLSYLSIIKLVSSDGQQLFYMRLFSDFTEEFGQVTHPEVIKISENEINDSDATPEEKTQIVKARIGQGKFREKLLEECPFCPITMVGEDRLLIASHIKPWVNSNQHEKIDPKNGFMFTPTIDRLFDQGFITFDDEKRILLTPWISKVTFGRLNLVANKVIEHLPISGRANYLKYHRENIFKGSV